ncbi:GntR family transcriptional regulator [Streptomyces beijiangensis]|uniref:GntR family transcriptional regulator n=1 Tax=Streptomyces beijiangensis TaxID=163361 RepID=A0A939FB81_9ACTN|nr:GntR family transcriptional regulator [Streptomyces beijiangensis]MBO0514974.1 GntR family transcriptional regulator [Streptomyces beijiangensis]
MPDDATPARLPERQNGADPLWSQAADLIQAEITRRGLQPGAKLPPERELCTQLGISRVTLRKALTHLVELGVVTASHGRGWFVAASVPTREWPKDLESFTATARRKHMKAGSLVLRQDMGVASLDEADRLDVPAGTPLLRLERVRLLNDVRIAVDRTLVDVALAPGIEDVDFGSDTSLFDELRQRGVELDRSETTIEARSADDTLAEHLGIEPGSPVLVLDQTVFGRGRRPVLLSTVEYSGDRYRLRTTLQSG